MSKTATLKKKFYNFVLCGFPYLLLFQEIKERSKVKQDDSELSSSELSVYKCQMIFTKLLIKYNLCICFIP